MGFPRQGCWSGMPFPSPGESFFFFFNDNLIGKGTRILFSFTNGLRVSLYVVCLIWRSNWTEGGLWFPWGRRREGLWLPWHPGAQQGGGRTHSPDFCSSFFFLTSIRTWLASVFSWLLTTFSLFDLLNVCFSQCSTPALTVYHSPQALGHLPGGNITCDVKSSSAPRGILILPPPSTTSFLPRMQMPRQWRG